MKIKDLRFALEEANPEGVVYFDFCRCKPLGGHSWRGAYDEPAIGWGFDETDTTVSEFISVLDELTSGKIYHGWKGGEYTYTEDQELHVDNEGQYTETEIIGVQITEWGDIILMTGKL